MIIIFYTFLEYKTIIPQRNNFLQLTYAILGQLREFLPFIVKKCNIKNNMHAIFGKRKFLLKCRLV